MKIFNALIIKEIPADKLLVVKTALNTVKTVLALSVPNSTFAFNNFEDGIMITGSDIEVNSAKQVLQMTTGIILESENP